MHRIVEDYVLVKTHLGEQELPCVHEKLRITNIPLRGLGSEPN